MHYRLLFFCCLYCLSLGGQPSLFDSLHASEAPYRIELATDWKKLIRRKADKAYQPLTLRVYGLGETPLEFPGRVRPRGHIRLSVCAYPSLKIKLKKEGLRKAGFSDLNDLKLVLQCSSGEVGVGYHRREKLVYRLHAVYSDHTHRIVPIQLATTGSRQDSLRAFFIEDEEQIAARYGGRILAAKKLSVGALEREAYVNMCLFNYLILNTDWAVFNLHNVEFVTAGDSRDLICIPYDFDYSGFVGTGYAVPQPQLNLHSIYEPKWLGRGVTPEELLTAAAHFRERREAAVALIKTYPGLTSANQRRLLKRLEDFYRLLDKEKLLLKLLK
ncbi:MAG: hypothetical protein AAFZ52_14730 [Bacteroidota bacterium]